MLINIFRESTKYFLSSKILAGLGGVAGAEVGGVLNSWVQRPQQTWSVIFRASEHGFQVIRAVNEGSQNFTVLIAQFSFRPPRSTRCVTAPRPPSSS